MNLYLICNGKHTVCICVDETALSFSLHLPARRLNVELYIQVSELPASIKSAVSGEACLLMTIYLSTFSLCFQFSLFLSCNSSNESG